MARRNVVAGVGYIYFGQLANRFDGPLQTGFIDWVETAVFGSPSVTFNEIIYGAETQRPTEGKQAWKQLVQRRMAAHRATPLSDLLRMDHSRMSQSHYAEGWTLVGLLASQPAKFGKLLLELRKGGSEMEAIEKVYRWDEKELTKEWRTYVMGQGKKGVKSRD